MRGQHGLGGGGEGAWRALHRQRLPVRLLSQVIPEGTLPPISMAPFPRWLLHPDTRTLCVPRRVMLPQREVGLGPAGATVQWPWAVWGPHQASPALLWVN